VREEAGPFLVLLFFLGYTLLTAPLFVLGTRFPALPLAAPSQAPLFTSLSREASVVLTTEVGRKLSSTTHPPSETAFGATEYSLGRSTVSSPGFPLKDPSGSQGFRLDL
jgi:hypothetical protein